MLACFHNLKRLCVYSENVDQRIPSKPNVRDYLLEISTIYDPILFKNLESNSGKVCTYSRKKKKHLPS